MINLKKFLFTICFLSCATSWANYPLKSEVNVTVNFEECRKAGFLTQAYLREDEWVVDFIQSDSNNMRKNVKDYSGTALEYLKGNRSYSFNTTLYSELVYSFRLRELDEGLYGDDDLYPLEEFTPTYSLNTDLTCIESKSCAKRNLTFTHKVQGSSEAKFCLKADFKIKLY